MTEENAYENILEMRNITKIYPNGFMANKNINFSVRKGEIHALSGENGAGKTTLMKMLFGLEKIDQGEVYIKGEKVDNINSPMDAIKHGIGMVHQHFMLVDKLTVAENIVLGIEPRKFGVFTDLKKAVKMTQEVAQKYNLNIDPYEKVGNLSVGSKQKLEILKALIRGVEILVLDEPTAVLTPQETDELFKELIEFKKQGHTIIFISHKLREVKELCDRITIIRAGQVMGVYNVDEVSEQDISRLMVGRDVILKTEKGPAHPKDVVLEVDSLNYTNSEGVKILNGINFELRAGQIMGIAGVEGNGQSELIEIITGVTKYNYGKVILHNQEIKNKSIRQIRDLGMSHIPQDRMKRGIAANCSIADNIVSDRYQKKGFSGKFFIHPQKIAEVSDKLIQDFKIFCSSALQPIGSLSGGNIQKVVVARELSSNPSVIVADQPTRGVDVGATEFIRAELVSMRDAGAGVLLISADLNEILELSDSIIVMFEGEIVAYFPDSSTLTEEELGLYMLGLKKMNAEQVSFQV